MKKLNKIAGITLMITALAIPAFAWGPSMGKGFEPKTCKNCDNCQMTLTTEQQEQMQELHKKMNGKTTDARNEMMKKQIDLNAVINSDKPDLKKAKAIQKEISKLQAKISQVNLEFIIEAKKINPDMPRGMGHQMGKGRRGMHRGMGMGRGM